MTLNRRGMTLGFTVYVAKRIEIAERARGGPRWGYEMRGGCADGSLGMRCGSVMYVLGYIPVCTPARRGLDTGPRAAVTNLCVQGCTRGCAHDRKRMGTHMHSADDIRTPRMTSAGVYDTQNHTPRKAVTLQPS